MYIRAKHYQNRTYYTVVRTERDGGKVRQRQVTYLGKHRTLESAISDLEARIDTAYLVVEQYQTRFDAPEMAAKEAQRLLVLNDRLELLRALQRTMSTRHATT